MDPRIHNIYYQNHYYDCEECQYLMNRLNITVIGKGALFIFPGGVGLSLETLTCQIQHFFPDVNENNEPILNIVTINNVIKIPIPTHVFIKVLLQITKCKNVSILNDEELVLSEILKY